MKQYLQEKITGMVLLNSVTGFFSALANIPSAYRTGLGKLTICSIEANTKIILVMVIGYSRAGGIGYYPLGSRAIYITGPSNPDSIDCLTLNLSKTGFMTAHTAGVDPFTTSTQKVDMLRFSIENNKISVSSDVHTQLGNIASPGNLFYPYSDSPTTMTYYNILFFG